VVLNGDAAKAFYDVEYALPRDVTKKGRITLKLQPKPGSFAGGLYGARVVRSK
jgi:hypothetical protein